MILLYEFMSKLGPAYEDDIKCTLHTEEDNAIVTPIVTPKKR